MIEIITDKMMGTIGTLFSGGGGADIGARQAGYEPIFAVEYDGRIADYYRKNIGAHVTVCDINELSPEGFPFVDVLHASPPCINASGAKAGSSEQPMDVGLAMSVVKFIKHLLPPIFTLENVWRYRNFDAWHIIRDCLLRNGYKVEIFHLNSADYGVPQKRKRMVVVARRDGKEIWKPTPTGTKWKGWWNAVSDLEDTFKPAEFANWQLARVPENWQASATSFAVFSNMTGLARAKVGQGICYAHEPANTIPAQPAGGLQKAFLVHSQKVVRLTSRALARLQTFPDEYELPPTSTLANRIVGNAVPPMLYKEVLLAQSGDYANAIINRSS